MRKIKKLVATLLAATMVMAMGVTAFAAGTTYNVSTTLYKNESCTSVSINRLDKYGLNIDWTATGS